ncbi:MAG: serine/threonine-protein kinase [Proteobacteria bacterium]|nr:serine/threonine-protein kinase [Pseudomonadota bacterium]
MSEPRSQDVTPRANTMLGAVLGSYRITGVLASGGMGTVFRATHQVLERPAAVKLLRRELSENADLLQRFFTEAKAATAIKHPGMIEVYDFGYTPEGRAYLVMELLEGEELARRLQARGRLSESDAIHVARGIASALVAAHAKGIVHRDLKPDNVFLVRDAREVNGERPKLLDFGIAKVLAATDGQTQTGALIGTPLYMAPEQARTASAIDHRADLYSLGCMLYEMLVGAPPFVAVGAGEIIAMQLFSEPTPPSATLPITPELETIVMRLLEKEPDARFQTAAQVEAALTNLRASGQVAPAFTAVAAVAPLATLGAQAASHVGRVNPSLVEQGPPPRPTSGAMPIVAGAITLGLAVVVLVVVLVMRGGGDAAVAATVPNDAGVATTTTTTPTPTTPRPPKPKPTKPRASDLEVITTPSQVDRAGAAPTRPRPTKPRPAKPSGPVLTPGGSPMETQLDDAPSPRPSPAPSPAPSE